MHPTPLDSPCTRAVILARGLGTRMRASADGLHLTPAQATQAARGLKGLIPDTRGRPFLAHVLSALADAGVTRVCMVVAPEHEPVSSWLRAHPPRRVQVDLVVQDEPRGTADALLAAEGWLAGMDALVLNADNLYPAAAVHALRTLDGPGTIAFDREALIRGSNIDAARISAFAILDVSDDGWLRGIIEKPTAAQLAAAPDARDISMNLWRIEGAVLDACRAVPLSARGEYELPQAIGHALALGQKIRVVRHAAGVLDLSSPRDIAVVAERLGSQACDP